MDPHDSPATGTPSPTGNNATDPTVSELVGKIYDAAPIAERCRMLDYLIRPLGALALVGVCNGMFTKIWFRSGWNDFHIKPEDAQAVQGVDVTSLAAYVQQSSAETINGLASLLTASPMMTYSAAVAILVTILVRRIQSGRTGSDVAGGRPD